jgi:hypothetical protein
MSSQASPFGLRLGERFGKADHLGAVVLSDIRLANGSAGPMSVVPDRRKQHRCLRQWRKAGAVFAPAQISYVTDQRIRDSA